MSLSAFVLVDAILLIGNHAISEYLRLGHHVKAGQARPLCPMPNWVHESGDLLDSVQGLFRLDPADQVLPANRFQQGRMVGGHVPPDHPDHLVIVIAPGHETAFASDQLHPRASYSGCLPQRNARMLA